MTSLAIPYGYCHCGCGEQTRLADQNHTAKGWIKGEPFRYVAGHNRRSSPVEYLVDAATGCWVWQRGIAPNGYGHMHLRPGEAASAHKVFYERAHGTVPAGAHIDHLCRNRACVNVEHMQVVTCAENARRGLSTKLSYADVAEIRALRRAHTPQRAIAARFGISRSTVSDIDHGRTWSAPGGEVIQPRR